MAMFQTPQAMRRARLAQLMVRRALVGRQFAGGGGGGGGGLRGRGGGAGGL
ncbi:MAG: hypothetical protein JWQ26_2476, partial [Modestobacter sp.]|nr:hypothetical protein [Modestobacter sp.]